MFVCLWVHLHIKNSVEKKNADGAATQSNNSTSDRRVTIHQLRNCSSNNCSFHCAINNAAINTDRGIKTQVMMPIRRAEGEGGGGEEG